MPKLAANLSMLFPQFDFLERFAAGRAAGFRYVEYQFPDAFAASDIARAAREAGVTVVLHNLPAGDAANGERGIACLPGREAEFRLAGLAPVDDVHFRALVANVRYAARRLGGSSRSIPAPCPASS